MQIRVYGMGNSEEPEYWGASIPRLENYGRDARLDVRSVKLFLDGSRSHAASNVRAIADR